MKDDVSKPTYLKSQYLFLKNVMGHNLTFLEVFMCQSASDRID